MTMTAHEKQRFKAMEDQLTDIDNKVDEILSALKGDKFGQSAGIIKDFQDLKSRVRKIENWKNKIIWTAMGAGIAAGFTLDKIWSLITKVIL